MKTCVFVGPSSGGVQLPADWDRYAPAAMGAIWRAVQQGYERVVLVDGVFGTVPAVWHKEILHALCSGVHVYGASSMGALRAAELAPYGMLGVGVIFRLYRAGWLTDDDEVCVIHGPREFGFKPLSLPMVSIRRTVSAMLRAGEVERDVADAALQTLKQHHFSHRTRDAVRQALGSSVAIQAFERRYDDLKTRDYQALLEFIRRSPAPPEPIGVPWTELQTNKWRAQFVDDADDIPPLEPW